MAAVRPKRKVEPAPATDAVTVPPELALGMVPEIWGDPAEPHGRLHELAMARFAWSDAARAWEASVGIGFYEHSRRLPRTHPGPPGKPPPTFAERLAELGLSPADVPALRRAAQARVRDTDTTAQHRRSTP